MKVSDKKARSMPRITTENIMIPAVCSVILYFLRKSTGWDLLYYINLLSIVWLLAAVTSRLCKNITVNIFTNKRRADLAAALIILIYGVTMSIMSVARHDAYSTSMYDLGNMDQAIWNSSQGNFLEVTSLGVPYLNVTRAINHLEWIYEIFALLYRIFPEVRLLLVVQTLFVCSGLTGVYFIARARMQSHGLSIVSLCAAAMFPALQFANLFDFHGDVLAFPFLVWMIYFHDVRKKRLAAVLLMAGALLCKEYAALVLTCYGIVMIIENKDWWWGSAVTLLSTGYFFAALYWIMPAFNNGNSSELISAVYTIKQGSGLYGLISAICDEPSRYLLQIFSERSFESLFYLFFPMYFFLWKKPVYLLPVVPVVIKDLLAGIDIGTHRLALALPFLFVAFLSTLKRLEPESALGKNNYRFKTFLVISAVVIASVAYGPSPVGHRFYREIEKYVKNKDDFARDSVIAHIPDSAVISVSGLLAPHCTHRRICYQFPRPFDAQDAVTTHADIVVLDTCDDESRIENHSGFRKETIPWILSMGYDQIMERNGVYLFQWSGLMDSKK